VGRGSSHRAGTRAGAAHAELTGGAARWLSMGASMAMAVDDRARQWLIAARGSGWPGVWDLRRWRPETSMVAQASGTRGGGGPSC
jgi:hypothetical protein